MSGEVSVAVYNISGGLVDILKDGYIESGVHVIDWNAEAQASGVYFFRVNYQDQSIVKKAILIK